MKKINKYILLTLVIILITTLIIGFSYAYFFINKEDKYGNLVNTKCFNIEYSDNGNINLSNQQPLNDQYGQFQTAYTFTIKNTCSIAANFDVNMELLAGTTIPSNDVKTMINFETPFLLSSKDNTTKIDDSSVESRKIYTGKVAANSSVTYALRLWLDENSLYEDVMGKNLNAKLNIVGSATTNSLFDNIYASIPDSIINYKKINDGIISQSFPNTIINYSTNISESSYEADVNIAFESSESIPCSDSYTFDNTKGEYSLTNEASKSASDLKVNDYVKYDYINKYDYKNYTTFFQILNLNSVDTTTTITKIKVFTVKSNQYKTLNEINYEYYPIDEINTTINIPYSDSYTYDSETGLYSLVNPQVATSYQQLVGKYYTYSTFPKFNIIIKCNNIYQEPSINLFFIEKNIVTSTLIQSANYNELDNGFNIPYRDDFGISYSFAGTNSNKNNVKFAGYCWKILKLNGDKTLKLLYNGTSQENGSCSATGVAATIGSSAYNIESNDNAYAGYMVGTPNSTNYQDTYANLTDSTIKAYIDNWYQQNLLSHASLISDGYYCNNLTFDYSTVSNGQDFSIYSKIPLTGCFDTLKGYTISLEATKSYFLAKYINPIIVGNKKLTYPIGLPTYADLITSGIETNQIFNNLYIDINVPYWTMSPRTGGAKTTAWAMDADGGTTSHLVSDVLGVRPIINLSKDAISITGDGSVLTPYVIKE